MGKNNGNGGKGKPKINWSSFEEEEPEHWAEIKEYYGLKDFPSDRLFIQKKGDKIVSFVSSTIRDFLKWDVKKQINTVYIGIKTFEVLRGNHYNSINENSTKKSNVVYRPLQSAIETIWPFMTKRKIKVSFNEFLYLSYNQTLSFVNLDQSKPNIYRIMTEIDIGCFAICCEVSEGIFEYLVASKMKASVVIMASKEHLDGLRVKYHEDNL